MTRSCARAHAAVEGLEDDTARLVDANKVLNTEITALRLEVASLRATMLTHVDCIDPAMQDAIRAHQRQPDGAPGPSAGPSVSSSGPAPVVHRDDIVVGAPAPVPALDPSLAQPEAESGLVAA